MTRVLIDATALDSGHRTRGIGRYVQGLLGGFQDMGDQPLGLDVSLLRTRPSEESTPFSEVIFHRHTNHRAARMFVENRLRLNARTAHHPNLFHATGMEGVITGVPWVATCHDLIPLDLRGPYLRPWDLEAQWFWRSYVRRLKKSPTRIIAISDFVRDRLSNHYGLDRTRIDVVRHGVAAFWFAEPIAPQDEVLRTIGERPFVLFVGGFDARKNIESVLEATRQSRNGIRLLVAGQRSTTTRLKHWYAARGCEDTVTFLEYVDDTTLRWLMSKATCLAFTSVAEGWGLPIVEAMAASCPVVCSGEGAMAEAADGAAYVVDVRSASNVLSAIQAILASRDLREDLRARGRERAEKLTWRACAEATAEVYRRALLQGTC